MTGETGNAAALRLNQKFLEAIFGPDYRFAHVCAVRGDPSKDGGYWGGGKAQQDLLTLGDKTNNYFCVSLFNGQRRRINTFEKLVALAVDDVGPKLEASMVELLLGPPTWIVETSQDNFQWGYKLTDPITDAAQAADLIHRVRVALTGEDGKDPGMENVTRYVRLPTGLNLKGTLGAPFRVRLRRLDPSIGLRSNALQALLNVPDAPGTTGQQDEFGLGEPSSSSTSSLRPSSSNKIKAQRREHQEEDVILKSMRKLGLVLGPPRDTAMGWGFDIRCPWVDEHTDRAETGTVYVAGAGKFKCQHGHCQERTVEDVRAKIDELLRDNGHKGGLICEEFDEIDPASVPAPPQGTKPKLEIGFFDRFVVMGGRNVFYDLHLSHEATVAEIDAKWTSRLMNVLPRVVSGVKKLVEKPIPPSRWLREQGRVVNGLIGWPGMPRVVASDVDAPDALYVNTWRPLKRPMSAAAETEVDEDAVKPWLHVFWHIVGTKLPEWEIGETLLDWLALVLGDQSRKAGWHVIIMGQHGVGKDSIILPITVTLGAHWAQTIQSQQISADFNEWAGKRLVQISETRQNTRGTTTAHDVMAILKAIFDNTRQWITVNPKYMPKHTARNVVMGWFTSNEGEPLRLEDGDRRFLVLDRTGTKPLPSHIYAKLHAWLTTSVGGASGIDRVAEYLLRRWDRMDDTRRAALFGVAPVTADKLALLSRLKHPVEDWIERCVALDAVDPLTFPDIVTAGYVHSRLFQAIRTGGEGLPGGTQLPGLAMVGVHLKAAGAVVLNGGKQVKVNGNPVVLWAVRSASSYAAWGPSQLSKLMVQGGRGTKPGTIN